MIRKHCHYVGKMNLVFNLSLNLCTSRHPNPGTICVADERVAGVQQARPVRCTNGGVHPSCAHTHTLIYVHTHLPLIIPPHVCQYTPIRWRVQFQGVLLVVDRVQSVDLLESPLKTRALCPVFFLSRLEVSLPLFQTTNLTPDSLPQRIGPEIWIGGLSDAHPRFRALWAQFMYTQ